MAVNYNQLVEELHSAHSLYSFYDGYRYIKINPMLYGMKITGVKILFFFSHVLSVDCKTVFFYFNESVEQVEKKIILRFIMLLTRFICHPLYRSALIVIFLVVCLSTPNKNREKESERKREKNEKPKTVPFAQQAADFGRFVISRYFIFVIVVVVVVLSHDYYLTVVHIFVYLFVTTTTAAITHSNHILP